MSSHRPIFSSTARRDPVPRILSAAALGVSQTALVLEIIERLASQGIAVLVISHNLTDVFRVADRIAILYLGRMVSSGPVANYDTNSAVHWMTTGTAPSVNSSAAPQSTEG